MHDIRNMLHDLSIKNQNNNQNRLSELIRDDQMNDDGSIGGRNSFGTSNLYNSPDKFFDGENEDNVIEFVKR